MFCTHVYIIYIRTDPITLPCLLAHAGKMEILAGYNIKLRAESCLGNYAANNPRTRAIALGRFAA